MKRSELFKKYYKHPEHDYELSETMSHTIEGLEPDIAFIFSGRNRGKSFEISSQCIANSYYDKIQFAYVRRNDATNCEIEQYFEDKKKFISDMSDGVYNGITVMKGKLHFYSEAIKEETNEVIKVIGECCGYFFALSRQSRFKSLQYPEVYNMIYEEVMSDSYLSGECSKFMNLYSTLKRNKGSKFKAYLISNTISQVCPYSAEWGINFSRMKPNEVKMVKLYLQSYNDKGEEDFLIIASHYLKNKNDLTKEDMKLKRNRVKTAIASNNWEELHRFTTIEMRYMKRYEILDTVVFEYDDMMFQANIVEVPTNIITCYNDEEEPASADTMPVLYIRRKTTEPFPYTRLYTNNAEHFGDYVTRGYVIHYKIDVVIDKLMKTGWVIGADNLTMNDFSKIFRQLQYLKAGFN